LAFFNQKKIFECKKSCDADTAHAYISLSVNVCSNVGDNSGGIHSRQDKNLSKQTLVSNIPENFNEKLQPPLVNLSNVMLKKTDEQLITNELRKTHLDRACNLQLEPDMYPNSTRGRFSTASAA